MHMQQSQESLARAIAEKAHADQVDKAGEPYIGHPAHVVASVEGDKAKAEAWLHDVVEDTSTTFDDLRAAGVDDEVVEDTNVSPYEIPVDATVLSLGIAPETGLVKELHKYFDNVVSLGDCVKPGRIGDATSAAFLRCKNL